MNLNYKNICRSPITIGLLFAVIVIEFISTKSTRTINSATILNFYFSSVTVFYAYAIIPSCFVAIKYNLIKMFENQSVIIRYSSLYNWFSYIRKNSIILTFFTVISFCLIPTIIGIIYTGINLKQIGFIFISIIVQILGLIVIDKIFDFFYIRNLNKLYSSLITIALVILPEYISKFFVIKLSTLTTIIFIPADNIYNLKYIISIMILDSLLIIILQFINKKELNSLTKKDLIFL